MLSTLPATDFEPLEPDGAEHLRLSLAELRDRRRRAIEQTREYLVQLGERRHRMHNLVGALQHEIATSHSYRGKSELRVVSAPARALSVREVSVLKQVASGFSNKQIAGRLGISDKTVRNHMTTIFEKLAVSNRTEAVLRAVRSGVLSV